MRWNAIGCIKNFDDYSYKHWISGIEMGYLVYMSQLDGLHIRKCKSLELIFEERKFIGQSVNYVVFDKRLSFTVDENLYDFNFDTEKLELVCKTKEAYIGKLNGSYGIGATFRRHPRINRNEIFRLNDCNVIYKWENRSSPIYISESGLTIFENRYDADLTAFNIETDIEYWSIKLEGLSVPRFYQDINEEIFLVMQCYDTEHAVDKRYELWGKNMISGEIIFKSKENHLRSYLYSHQSKMLHGVSGQRYVCVNALTGQICCDKILEELGTGIGGKWANLGNQSISGEDLYFTLSREPLIGRFNLVSERVEEFIKIDVEDVGNGARELLGTPFFHENRLYVRDCNGVMHVLEKEVSVVV